MGQSHSKMYEKGVSNISPRGSDPEALEIHILAFNLGGTDEHLGRLFQVKCEVQLYLDDRVPN